MLVAQDLIWFTSDADCTGLNLVHLGCAQDLIWFLLDADCTGVNLGLARMPFAQDLILIVDTPFCPGYCVRFYFWLGFGPICVKVRVWASNLFCYTVYLIYRVFDSLHDKYCSVLIFILYLIVMCLNVVSFRAMFLVLIFVYIKCRSILINYFS